MCGVAFGDCALCNGFEFSVLNDGFERKVGRAGRKELHQTGDSRCLLGEILDTVEQPVPGGTADIDATQIVYNGFAAPLRTRRPNFGVGSLDRFKVGSDE